MKSIERKRNREHEIRALFPEEVRNLLLTAASMFPDALPSLVLKVFAGVRPTEMGRLKWQDISQEENVISIRSSASKTGGTRHVSIRPTLLAWIDYIGIEQKNPEELITEKMACQLERKLRKTVEYNTENPWPQDVLRHTFATYCVKAGEDLTAICWDMGHADTLHLRQRYTNMRGITSEHCREFWALTPDKIL